ncbi:MAG: exopolysaccharide biosynthesis protein [Alphaproteobacteria bacterium]|nr:exopolysaccharide biosynthesis protein [Alphaproteobacteria bacterium]
MDTTQHIPRALTTLLDDLKTATPLSEERTELRTIVDTFQDRGFGVLLFFLALPAALPIPALGINMIIALPILLLTFQQVVGRHKIWLPEEIKKRTIKTKHLHSFIDKSVPLVKYVERFISPRLGIICSPHFTRLVGIFGAIFALSITLPIPLTNTVPAMAIALMSIGIILRDGIAVILGICLGTFWISLLVYVIIFFGTEGFALIKGAIKVWIGL